MNTSPVLGTPSLPHYPTCLTLVMEKGAHSTFKLTYNRLRAGWQYVPLSSPLESLADLLPQTR
jgi:hypothetical protein